MIINGVDTSQVVYSTSYVITDAKSGDILLRFDTIEECSFKSSSTVTSYPTEMGIMASDYKYKNSDSFKAKGLIARRSTNAQQVELITNQLKHYQSGMYAMNIQTKSGLRENYTLEGYEVVESVDNYSLLEVDMEFKEMPKFLGQNNRDAYDDDTRSGGISQVNEVQ
ncbi:MAG: hypothetical protein J6S67_21900 [Methanobrevibacter sp.]|nr:hypothetical protein [Methanobrevibacter sp.]